MRAILKDIDFYGVIIDKSQARLLMLEDSYCIQLCLSIGVEDSVGADYFYVDVFNLNWVKKSKFMLGYNSIIFDSDDFDELEKELKILVNSIEGESWEDILNILRKYFAWEYEDHKFVNLE